MSRAGGEYRHGVDHAAVVTDLAGVHAVVDHTDAQEQRTGDKSVGDHLYQRALHAQCRVIGIAGGVKDAEHDKETQSHKSHMGNG